MVRKEKIAEGCPGWYLLKEYRFMYTKTASSYEGKEQVRKSERGHRTRGGREEND